MRPKKFLSSLLISLLLLGNSPLVLANEGDTPPAEQTTTEAPASDTGQAPAGDGSTGQEPPAEQPPQQPAEPPAEQPAEPPAQQPAETPAQQTASPAPTQQAAPQRPPKPDYAFDGTIRRWVETRQDSFYWDPVSGHWQSPYYRYDAHLDRYWVLSQAEVQQNLASDAQRQRAAAILSGLVDPLNIGNGPGSTNNASLTNINNVLLQLLSTITIDNNESSTATSGDAEANANTGWGKSETGLASVVSNLLNFINSAFSWANGGLASFVKNIYGGHTGDITIDPQVSQAGGGGQLGGYNPALGGISANEGNGAGSNNTATTTNQNDLTIVNRPVGTINNNLDLLATSGNATANQNLGVGDALSGDAFVALNILNLINSAIGAGQSFFGMLNVFGDLNGDILFPHGFLDGATAGTGVGNSVVENNDNGTGSTNTASHTANNNTNITNSPSAFFNNNLNLAAQTGDASANENLVGGSATTGKAKTDSNLFNFFNSSLFGDNAVLVFVNVMGKWMGGIMNLPTSGDGTENGLLTGNALVQNVGNGAGSTNNASVSDTNNTNITNSPTGFINNNINAGAVSGDASANQNNGGGTARSGDATVVSNVANFFGSQLNIKKWFGVLFINVFGDWTGKVNEDTAAGEVQALGIASQSVATLKSFVPGGSVLAQITSQQSSISSGSGTGGGSSSSSINTVTVADSVAHNLATNRNAAERQTPLARLMFVFSALLLAGAAFISHRQKRSL